MFGTHLLLLCLTVLAAYSPEPIGLCIKDKPGTEVPANNNSSSLLRRSKVKPEIPYLNSAGLLVKCELQKCEWILCELKYEPARDWSDIFRPTCSYPA